MKILLHSSKTMKPEATTIHELTEPQFIIQASYLSAQLGALNVDDLTRLMAITPKLAKVVHKKIAAWDIADGSAAALTFRGDIYSGLSAAGWGIKTANFAQEHLLILSGLYGLLRPFDKIAPYRLEMGYKLTLPNGLRLDAFWEQQLMGVLNKSDTYINLTANEYFKVIKKQLSSAKVLSPKFLTINKKTGQPDFVTVHAKIARGSFADWLITNSIDDPAKITGYDRLNYQYDKDLSSELEPVFVCSEFGGLGLSVRLK